jgi:hypothetical protein
MTAELGLDKSVKMILRLLLERSRRVAGQVVPLLEGETRDLGDLYTSQRSTLYYLCRSNLTRPWNTVSGLLRVNCEAELRVRCYLTREI